MCGLGCSGGLAGSIQVMSTNVWVNGTPVLATNCLSTRTSPSMAAPVPASCAVTTTVEATSSSEPPSGCSLLYRRTLTLGRGSILAASLRASLGTPGGGSTGGGATTRCWVNGFAAKSASSEPGRGPTSPFFVQAST